MSRRSILSGIFEQSVQELAAANLDQEPDHRGPAGPVRSMALTLGKMEEEAKAFHEALQSGQHVQELDPELIDSSFVRDRLDEIVFTEGDPFLQSIAETGQEVPILVRPHPEKDGRFQVAYGHRRLKAASVLGIKVRAIVREVDDTALVVAQGIENSGRENLSYIERAVFAFTLESRGFARPVIMQALSTDKTELSKLISVASAVPADVIQAIGSARGIGRRRWIEFANIYIHAKQKDVTRVVHSHSFLQLSSDERFEAVLASLILKRESIADQREWKPKRGGNVVGTIRAKERSFALALKADDAAPFGRYLSERLDELYDEFVKTRETK
ncbi:plasmid partitioning protein RepB [Rhizobium sp. NXC24]|uniref:plasmid partitioning protein RepB n=1 Tax=Rhizobium sp. NXC24 TaxID=2048897 RepID=UPI000CDF3A25|nr:plasmid partitioning protein RepB [Rhizobium sp. NXC24]AVA23933.1 plasmid partitioning protein RepB 1 [Rhizobium sp. NXC24]